MSEETINISNPMGNLFKALCKAQKEFKEPKRTKKAYNYKYAPMDEVRNATIEGLINNGLSVIQFPVNDGEKVGVETILAHESGESISNSFSIALSKKNAPKKETKVESKGAAKAEAESAAESSEEAPTGGRKFRRNKATT